MAREISFDRNRVLEIIQGQFWNSGYAATSLFDLMQATELGKGSLYGTYGSKHDMYLAAFTDYCAWVVEDLQSRLRGSDNLLARASQSASETWRAKSGQRPRRGCMLAKGPSELSGLFHDVDIVMQKMFKTMESEIQRCVLQAQRYGDIDPHRDARTVAVTILAMLRGMEALKRAGVPQASVSLAAAGALYFLIPTKA